MSWLAALVCSGYSSSFLRRLFRRQASAENRQMPKVGFLQTAQPLSFHEFGIGKQHALYSLELLMVLRIERAARDGMRVLRICGDLTVEGLAELKGQMSMTERWAITLDLSEISLVDVQAVRFLSACEAEGVTLLHCPAFIWEWINRERQR